MEDIAITPDGNIWVSELGSVGDSLLARFDGQTWSNVAGIKNPVYASTVAPDGALWLVTNPGGVYRLEK